MTKNRIDAAWLKTSATVRALSLTAPGVTAGRGRHRLGAVLHRLAVLLGRDGLVCRACPVERAAGNGIEWRTRAFDAGDILAAAVGESRRRGDDSSESRKAKSEDDMESQVFVPSPFARRLSVARRGVPKNFF